MKIRGNLLKMGSRLESEVEYNLEIDDKNHEINQWIGRRLSIHYLNRINCIHCGTQTKTSFSQGYCYKCYTTMPQCDVGVIQPELNQAHLGISRDMEWSRLNDLIEHVVYIAATSDFKVGVTRITQVPTRWIDQGAEYAVKLAVTPYRQLAGLIEVSLKPHIKDKTDWRGMLTRSVESSNGLLEEKLRLSKLIPDELKQYITMDDYIHKIQYPIDQHPVKVKSLNLEKTPEYSGILMGIKGQYLIFEDGSVMNVRKYNGYYVEIEVE